MLSREFLIFLGNKRNHFLLGASLDVSEVTSALWPCSYGVGREAVFQVLTFTLWADAIKSAENYFPICCFEAQALSPCLNKPGNISSVWTM